MASSLLHRPRARTLATIAAVAAAAVPVVGCGDSSSGGGGNAAADPATFLPGSAPVYLEVQVRPGGDLKANVETVAGKILRTSDPGAKVVELLDKELKDDGESYAKNIEPWLGQRAGLAVTAIGRGGDDADIAVALASKDDDAAKAFVSSRKGATEREYRGVKYRFKSDDDLAAAVVDHAVVLGTERGFKSAIDARSGNALSEGADFKKARETVGTDGLGFVYADPGRLFDLAVGAASGTAADRASAQQLQAVKGLLTGSGLRSVAAKLDVAKDAIRLDAAVIGLKKGAVGTGKGDAAGAVAGAPADAWLSLGVGDVGGTFMSAIKSAGSMGGATGGLDPATLMRQLKTALNIDVEKDILSWMGDANVFVQGTTLSDLGGALVVKSKDPAASRAAIGKLRKLAETLGGKVDGLGSAAGAGAAGFTIPADGVPGGGIKVASKDDTFVVAIGDGALRAALTGGDKLGDSEAYKTAAGLLDGAKPSLFVDTPQVVKLLEGFAGGDEDFAKAKPTLDAFGPAAAGGTNEGDIWRLKVAVSVP